MAIGLALRGLAAAAAAIARLAKNPAVRKLAVKAAQKAKKVFKAVKKGAKQACRKLKGRSIKYSDKQLQKKFKHAKDFGVKGNYNPKNAQQFKQAIDKHVMDSGTKVIKGTYKGNPATHYVNPKTGLNVIKDGAGNFQSGWKMSPAQLKHVLNSGKLGGG